MPDPDASPSTADEIGEATVRALLGRVRHDPRHLPETLATFGVGRLGPVAAQQIPALRAEHPEWDLRKCRAEVLRRGTRSAVSRGALIGGPLLALAPYGFCAALLVQNRIVLELATLAGRDPTTPERAAELLVLQDAFPDLAAARAGLAEAHAAEPPRPPVGKFRALWRMTWRMAYLLGLLSRRQEGERRDPWWLHMARWMLMGFTFLVGMVAPMVWMPYLADSYRQSTARIARRAERFYFGDVTAVRHVPDHASRRLATASVLLTGGLVLVTLLAGIRLFDRTWVAVVVALAAGSLGG
ncbi:MAG: hypothetical protein HOW97_36645, partial [Catenulispora sp.]|nr:hypothetical protein [Catenulispora sp.]